jgi:hypothetical protein
MIFIALRRLAFHIADGKARAVAIFLPNAHGFSISSG